MTVGVMGASGGVILPEVSRKVYDLGKEIARRGYVLITGACPGLPHEAVRGAKSAGGFVVGISPALNIEEHVLKFQSPTWGYDAMIYTGSGLMGREIENIRSCDVVVFAGGRSGTLGEFSIAFDEGKVIGIMDQTGGITMHLRTIVSFINKDTGSVIVSSADPVDLIDQLEHVYKTQILPRYDALLAAKSPHGIPEE